jgi:pimeloyl-ACP methyl ester carboxylesterase
LPIECHGTGSPTVVYIAGARADPSLPAPALFDVELPTTQRVCAYERLGIGKADGVRPEGAPSTFAQGADDLEKLLAAAGERGPFVLVAHQFGGYFATAFADRYPNEVGGIVMLDVQATPELIPTASIRADGDAVVDLTGSKQELIRAEGYGTTPLIVISSKDEPGADDWVPAWIRFLHMTIAAQSADSLLLKAPTSGTDLFDDVPALVLDAVQEVTEAFRTGHAMRPCDERFTALEATCLSADEPAAIGPEELVGWWTSGEISAADVESFVAQHGFAAAAAVTRSVGLPGVLTIGFGRGWFVAGTKGAPLIDHGTYVVEGDTLVLTSDGVRGTTVLRWSIRDGALSMELISDTLPDHEDGLPDEAYNLAIYDLPTFTLEQ